MQKITFKESEDVEIRCTFDISNNELSDYKIYSHITTMLGDRETLDIIDSISSDNTFTLFGSRYTIPAGKYKADIIIASTVNNEIIVSETFALIMQPAITDLRIV